MTAEPVLPGPGKLYFFRRAFSSKILFTMAPGPQGIISQDLFKDFICV